MDSHQSSLNNESSNSGLFNDNLNRNCGFYKNEQSPALNFELNGTAGSARAAIVHLPHGDVRTPVFMPVGTKGTIKGLSSEQLSNEYLSPEIILGNTYHLALQPGTELIAEFGGLHNWMKWENNLLTDSGGFQMVSLLDLAEVIFI